MTKPNKTANQLKVPPLLYQYRPPKPWAFYNLLRGVVRYSHRWAFNDPCEYLVPPSLVGLSDEDFERLREDAPELFEQAPGDKAGFIEYHDKQLRNVFLRARRRSRFVCFSECKENFLMWSHYAGGGKGFCLEFETAKDRRLFKSPAKMTYQEEWPGTSDAVKALTQKKHQKGAYQGPWAHKAKEWEYEKEWRLLDRHWPIPHECCPLEREYMPKALKAIYLGVGAEASTKKQIQDIVTEKYRHAELWEAFLVDDKYKMDFDPANDAARAAHVAR